MIRYLLAIVASVFLFGCTGGYYVDPVYPAPIVYAPYWQSPGEGYYWNGGAWNYRGPIVRGYYGGHGYYGGGRGGFHGGGGHRR